MQKSHYDIKNKQHTAKISLLAENIRTPENVGMILRLAEAFGISEVFFSGIDFSDLPTKAKRASRNTYKTIHYHFNVDAAEKIKEYIALDYQTIALEITEQSRPIRELLPDSNGKFLILIGSERQGISEELLHLCEKHYHIPMFGDNSSLNVVNALSIGLYKITEDSIRK